MFVFDFFLSPENGKSSEELQKLVVALTVKKLIF
jgi:hypothetical protein